ncbi:hypothetical protein ACLOJK_028982 [Asimina triloba]
MVRNLIILCWVWMAVQGLGMQTAIANATGNASVSVQNALVSMANASFSLICQCNSTDSWCRGVGNASIGNFRASSSANVSCQRNCNCNCDTYIEQSSQKLAEFIDPKYDRVVYILAFAMCSLLLMVLLIFLSPFRRHSRNRFLIAALWASQALPFTIIAHTLGLMQSPPYHNRPYAIWATLCLLIYGISSSRLYGLHDQQQEKKQLLNEGMLLYWAGWSMHLHHPGGMLAIPLLSILGVAVVKFLFRFVQICLSYSPSCRFFGLRRRVKVVADFMSFEHELSRPVDPISMTGYKYLVKGEEDVGKLMADKEDYLKNSETINETAVTVETIWQCKGELIGGGEDLKDKCLSFALFRLLAMKFRGFRLHKEHLSKTWGLVRDGLLLKQNNYERAFRVIEDELSFLHDYLYTQYPLLFSDGKFFAARTAIYAFLELTQFLAGLWIIMVLSKEFKGEFSHRKSYGFCQDGNRIWSPILDFNCSPVPADIHFLGACIFVLVYVVLQILQLLAIVSSNWAKVWLVCAYVKRPRWQGNRTLECLIGYVCHWNLIPLKPWRRKMEQYSLLSSYKYRRPLPSFLTSALFELPKRGQESQDSKNLDLCVEAAVLDALKDNDLQLTNGLSSLERNKIDSPLFWACRLKSITDTILVWHVATSFCALHQKYGRTSKEEESACECLSKWCCAHLLDCCKSKEEESNREVAVCLSGYCAYLVAFVPALLPDPTDSAELVFDQAILDARELLGKCRDLGGVYRELRKVGKKEVALTALGKKNRADGGVKAVEVAGFSEKVVVAMGAKLGMQLLSETRNDEARLWKVLVDFWAEMMLFLAPSNNVTAHAKSLANGGEFITHLWALLTHVGGCRLDSENSHPVGDDDAIAKSQRGGSQTSATHKSTEEETNDSQDIQDGTDDCVY